MIPETYSETTQSIKVTAIPIFLEEESSPPSSRYVWAYHMCIENHGHQTVRLLKRHWRIIDSNGVVEEIQGDGVVGKQPTIQPGEAFEYTSGAPLGTPSGMMLGKYQMTTEGGQQFDVVIPPFSLDSPHQEIKVN
jgi:ApaG protein